MTQESNTYREFVEQHVRLLNALSDALEAGRDAIVSFRLPDVQDRIDEQKRLCILLGSLHTEMRRRFPLAPSNQESLRDAGDLRRRFHDARQRLRRLNREQQALLQRSRRTVNALLNGFRSFEGTYASEALQQTTGGSPLRERA